MIVTVILCTHNRCGSLGIALESIARQTFPEPLDWEVLVVDNNSSDQTRAVAERFCARYPGRFGYRFESRQGKSHALNTGIREARGQILAFVDDDVTVEPDWLAHLTRPLLDGDYAGAGGRILLNWTSAPPRWLSMDGPNAMCGVLAGFDLGDTACELTGNDVPFGANMAFRKAMFEKHGLFRIDMGPTTDDDTRKWSKAVCPRNSEDAELGRRLIAAGERLRYEPAAVVHHPVPEYRLKKSYFLAWWFDNGRGMAREYGIPPGAKCYCGVPRYLIRSFAARALQWTFALRPADRFRRKSRVWQKAGEIVESRRQLLRAKSDGATRFETA